MNTFKAKIVGKASKEISKENGAVYVLMNAEILEGPAKGKVVPASRTIKNAKGLEKTVPELETEVTLYHTMLPSSTTQGKFVHFFEIQTGLAQASNDELSDLFSNASVAKQAI